MIENIQNQTFKVYMKTENESILPVQNFEDGKEKKKETNREKFEKVFGKEKVVEIEKILSKQDIFCIESVFEEIFVKFNYPEKIKGFIKWKYSNLENDLDDLVQEVCIALLRYSVKYNPPSEYCPFDYLNAFVFRVTRWTVGNHFKRGGGSDFFSLDDPFDSDSDITYSELLSSDSVNQEQSLINKESEKKLIEYISEFSKTEIQIIILRGFKGKPYKEIAEILGLSEVNVRVCFLRVKNQIYKFLKKEKISKLELLEISELELLKEVEKKA